MRNNSRINTNKASYLFFCRHFALALIASLFAHTSVFSQDEIRLSATWQVKNYDISVTFPQNETERSVSVRTTVSATNVSSRPASTMTLRISPNALISSVSIAGSTVEFAKREEKIGASTLQQIVVRMAPIQPGGSIEAAVEYKFQVKDNSGLAALSPIGSQFLPLSFWYPTPNSWFFARGADYAPVKINVTAAPGTQAVSAGIKAVPSDTAGNIARFDSRLNLQPFLITGNWDQIITPSGIELYLPRGSNPDEKAIGTELANLASEARGFYEKRLGKLPEVPVRLVAVKRGAGFSGGGVIFFDRSVLRRPKTDAQTALNIGESIARLWLGGICTITGDGGDAIREGLARHLANEFLSEKFGKEVADVERTRQRAAYAAVVQRDAPISSVSPLDDYYYSVVANKASMIWRLLERKTGREQFYSRITGLVSSGRLTLVDIRGLFPEQKEFLDYAFDQITDTNLMVGLPQVSADGVKVALRNTGSIDATADVVAFLENGRQLSVPATIKSKNFGEVTFKTSDKVVRVEIDSEKLYPQTDYSDDIAPREFTETDSLLAVKRLFDKQDYVGAINLARKILTSLPAFDDVRIFLGRSLLATGSIDEADKEFRSVYDSKLPSARGMSWAMVGIAEIAARRGRNNEAIDWAKRAIVSDGDYGASLSARALRNRIGAKSEVDQSIADFFKAFDRAAAANQKAQLDGLAIPGESSRFISGVAGQTVIWNTAVTHIDPVGPDAVLVECSLNVKLLNREPESGTAVYRLVRTSNGWRLFSVDMFEVR